MSNKTLGTVGICAYLLSVIASATDSKSDFLFGPFLVLLAETAKIAFIIFAIIRIWHISTLSSIVLFITSSLYFGFEIYHAFSPPQYGNSLLVISNINKVIWSLSYFWCAIILRKFGKFEEVIKPNQEQLSASSEHLIAQLKSDDSIDKNDEINPPLQIGRDFSWAEIINHVFRVIKFERNGTTITQSAVFKTKGILQPYGFLLVKSPMVKRQMILPIIHRDDFWLAVSVFDEPELAKLVESDELLVCYSPQTYNNDGFSTGLMHVLHYGIARKGTLGHFYKNENAKHVITPKPEKLFGSFVYEGEIKVSLIGNFAQ